jgi:nitroimidazol reductase NimA-like FMN-containing flavoprotein (pyridoxamine 5'-phosphate oxidase superfamily)
MRAFHPTLGPIGVRAFDEGMGATDPRTWMEHLSEHECWELLESTPIGRIGVLVDSAPESYPLNFAVDDRTIVFRTELGRKLRGLDRSPSVCFEVDGYDEATSTGWSVLIKGRAHEVTSAVEERHLLTLDLRYWGLGPKPIWIRIDPAEVTGRRISRPEKQVRS